MGRFTLQFSTCLLIAWIFEFRTVSKVRSTQVSYILKALFRETPLAYRGDLVWLKGVLVMNALSIVYLLFCEVFSRKLQIFYCFIIFIFIASLYFIWSMDQKSKTRSRDAKKWQRNKTECLWGKTYLIWQNFVFRPKFYFFVALFLSFIYVTLGNSGYL